MSNPFAGIARVLRRCASAASIALAGCGGGAPPDDTAVPASPNVLLVVFDTTRTDRLSLYGHDRPTTPGLDALGERSAVFETAYAPTSLTGPSHATLFTGRHPFDHGVWNNGHVLHSSARTLAEIFSDRGYATCGIVSSFVLDRRFGYAQGFDHFDDTFTAEQATVKENSWRRFEVGDAFDRRGDHTTDRAIRWLETRDGSKPFFLFIHYFDPHSPYEPPPAWRDRFVDENIGNDPTTLVRAWYDAEIAYTDHQFARLLDAVRATPSGEDTLIVVTADHGEGLLDHGYELHGLKIYEEEVRVPLIVSWPERAPSLRVTAPVTLADVAPTLCALLDLPFDMDGIDGIDLSGVLLNGEPLDENRPIRLYRRRLDEALYPSVLSQLVPVEPSQVPPPIYVNGEQFGLRLGDWKYIIAPGERMEFLFHLATDPRELNNRVAHEPERAENMRHVLERWVGARPPLSEPGDALGEEERTRLEALGYVQ